MLGWISYEEGKEKTRERIMVGNAAMLHLSVPRGKNPRCSLEARHAARFLARRRVRLAVLPPDYPYAGIFLRCGIAMSDTTELYRACAAKIAQCALRQNAVLPQSAGVALLARNLSPALQNAAHELSGKVRYLTLRVPNGEKLARELRWEYGIAVHLPQEGELLCADVAVSFDGEKTADCPLLPLEDGKMKAVLCAQIEGKTYRDPALLAALLAADALKTEKISVERVILPPPPNFP